jgi:hypothetical protein
LYRIHCLIKYLHYKILCPSESCFFSVLM